MGSCCHEVPKDAGGKGRTKTTDLLPRASAGDQTRRQLNLLLPVIGW